MIDKKKAQNQGLKIIDSTQEDNPLKSTLEQNFPQTITEGQFNLKAIATLLGINPDSNSQGYELTFTGKGLANTLYTTPVEFELKEESERSKDRESTQNSIIIGDNLDVLKILKSAYYEKIKMIYIDPPYNTKSENFIYPDDFRKDYQNILREVGLLELDEEGNEVESKTLQTFRNITGSRSHSGWLSFMLPRLKLARDLLREDGVIFISIDDNEQANLKILCDEIFGEENFICNFCWQKNFAPKNDNKYISQSTDNILCYAKIKDMFQRKLLPRTEKHNQGYSNPDGDPRGEWTSGSLLVTTFSSDSVYEIVAPNGTKHMPPNGRSWRYSKETLCKLMEEQRIWFGKDGNATPRVKRFLSEMPNGVVPQNLLLYQDAGSSQDGNQDLAKLFNTQIFDFPKPIKLLKLLMSISTDSLKEDLVLDFFAGSGTTAQAVMELNAEDGGNRKFILVQLPEVIEDSKNKTAYDFVKNELGRNEPKISDITIERVHRAGEKLKQETNNLDIGYRVYSLSPKAKLSDEATIIPHSAEISPQDIARNLALFAGKPLHIPLEEIVENKLFACEDILCVVEIDKEVEAKILEEKNKAIFIDGYGNYTLESFLNLNIPNDERVNIVY